MTTQDSAYELRRGGQGRWAGRRKLLPFIVVALAAAMAIVLLLSGRGGPGQERLDVTIKELEAEIERVQAELAKKRSHEAAAAQLFKPKAG